MNIEKLDKIIPPVGFINMNQVAKILAEAKYGADWFRIPHAKQVPYRVAGKRHGYSGPHYLRTEWEPSSKDKERKDRMESFWSIPGNTRKEAQRIKREYNALMSALLDALRNRQVPVKIGNSQGHKSLAKAPDGILYSQWVNVVETGRFCVKLPDRDELWTVFFDEKKVRQLASGKIERVSSKSKLSVAECAAYAEKEMPKLRDKAKEEGIELVRADYERFVQGILSMKDSYLKKRQLNESVWKASWRETQFPVEGGRRDAERLSIASNFVEKVLNGYRKKTEPK